MRRSFSLLVLGSIGLASVAHAQAKNTISPGMTRAQVTRVLGKPLVLREADGYTYIFYKNQCTRACGMNDLVVLHGDSVVDAIFRSSERHYTGASSSPEMIPARVAARATNGTPRPLGIRDSAPRPRMKPVEANDIRPSIPVKPPQVKPVPQTEKKTSGAPSSPAPKKP